MSTVLRGTYNIIITLALTCTPTSHILGIRGKTYYHDFVSTKCDFYYIYNSTGLAFSLLSRLVYHNLGCVVKYFMEIQFTPLVNEDVNEVTIYSGTIDHLSLISKVRSLALIYHQSLR